MRIVMRVLGIGMAEIVGWGGDDKVDAPVGYQRKDFFGVPADNPVHEWVDICRFRHGHLFFGVLRTFPDSRLASLVPNFLRPHDPCPSCTFMQDRLKGVGVP